MRHFEEAFVLNTQRGIGEGRQLVTAEGRISLSGEPGT